MEDLYRERMGDEAAKRAKSNKRKNKKKGSKVGDEATNTNQESDNMGHTTADSTCSADDDSQNSGSSNQWYPPDRARWLVMERLLEEYNVKIAQHEHERSEIIKRLQDIEVSQIEVRSLRRGIVERDTKVAELKAQIEELRSQVYQRMTVEIDLQGELERTKAEVAAKEATLNMLSSLQPTTMQAASFFRDCRPDSVTARSPEPPADARSVADAATNVGAPVVKVGKKVAQADQHGYSHGPVRKETKRGLHERFSDRQHGKVQKQQPVVRIIYLPHERTDHLLKMVESLSAQLEQLRKSGTERELAAQSGAEAVQSALREQVKVAQRQTATAMATAEEREGQLQIMTKELLETRHELAVTQRALAESDLIHGQEAETAQRAAENLADGLRREGGTAVSEMEAVARNLEQKLAEKGRECLLLRAHFDAAHEQALKRVSALTERIHEERTARKAVERRRSLEREGLARDVQALKNTTRSLEAFTGGASRWLLRNSMLPMPSSGRAGEDADKLENEVAQLMKRVEALRRTFTLGS